MGVLDNLRLGWAGVEDLAAHAVGADTHFAADVYAEQTAQEQHLSTEQAAAVQARAVQAEAGGLVEQAAAETVDQVVETVEKTAESAFSLAKELPWIAGGLLLLVLLVKLA